MSAAELPCRSDEHWPLEMRDSACLASLNHCQLLSLILEESKQGRWWCRWENVTTQLGVQPLCCLAVTCRKTTASSARRAGVSLPSCLLLDCQPVADSRRTLAVFTDKLPCGCEIHLLSVWECTEFTPELHRWSHFCIPKRLSMSASNIRAKRGALQTTRMFDGCNNVHSTTYHLYSDTLRPQSLKPKFGPSNEKIQGTVPTLYFEKNHTNLLKRDDGTPALS